MSDFLYTLDTAAKLAEHILLHPFVTHEHRHATVSEDCDLTLSAAFPDSKWCTCPQVDYKLQCAVCCIFLCNACGSSSKPQSSLCQICMILFGHSMKTEQIKPLVPASERMQRAEKLINSLKRYLRAVGFWLNIQRLWYSGSDGKEFLVALTVEELRAFFAQSDKMCNPFVMRCGTFPTRLSYPPMCTSWVFRLYRNEDFVPLPENGADLDMAAELEHEKAVLAQRAAQAARDVEAGKPKAPVFRKSEILRTC